MLCPNCQKNKIIPDITFGVLPCDECQQKRRMNKLPNPVEMVGESVLKQREEYAKTLAQPFNSSGEFSEEYYDAWGTKGVQVTQTQVKKRKRIWDKAVSINTNIKNTK
jgi:hypothetical protein